MRSSRFYEKVCEPFNKERFEKDVTHDLQFISDWNNFKMFQVYDTDGKLNKKSEHNLELIKGDYEELNGILKMIARVAVIDDILLKAQRQGRITFMMGSFGETGGILGVTAGLKFTDLVMTQYREQCIFYYRGFPLSAALDQCTGNKRCITLGRQMPHHYGFPEGNIAFVSSPLGTQISHAAGAGYGFRISGKDKICCVWFGEGCASEGDYHAGVNFGQTLGCQTLFMARNNKYAISTHQTDQYEGSLTARGYGYGMKTIRVDGNDVAACMAASRFAREFIVREQKPVMMEIMTYRIGDHSTSDHSILYRDQEEIDSWNNGNNPTTRLVNFLESQGKLTVSEEDLKQVRADTQKEVLKELKRASQEKLPKFTSLFDDVYDKLTPNLELQRQELIDLVEKYPEHYNPKRYDIE